MSMEVTTKTIRVATYNVHKCQGLDRRVSPARIIEVLREIDADVIALQEVLAIEDGAPEQNQARFIAEALGMEYRLGENRRLRGGAYGNAVLSRLPFDRTHNYDLTVRGREARGSLRTDLQLGGGSLLHIFNVHLGTSFFERRTQARRLLEGEILNQRELGGGARVVLGDFNEWTRGLASRLLEAQFSVADPGRHLRRSRTYPGVLPFLHLDHIYFDPKLRLDNLYLHRSRRSLVASDHLPLAADFRWHGRENAEHAE
jgi:endonuclease/exonuclease/phosphatase family metal-dependent hydrolase